MNKVYLIEGSCGAYSYYCHWIFRAFLDHTEAEDYCQELNSKLKSMNMSCENTEPMYDYSKKMKIQSQIMLTWDANFRYDYTGTMYEVKQVDLEE